MELSTLRFLLRHYQHLGYALFSFRRYVAALVGDVRYQDLLSVERHTEISILI